MGAIRRCQWPNYRYGDLRGLGAAEGTTTTIRLSRRVRCRCSKRSGRSDEVDKMRIVIGSDHAGFPLKGTLIDCIRQLGHRVVDIGTYGTEPVDYPDYAEALGKALI